MGQACRSGGGRAGPRLSRRTHGTGLEADARGGVRRGGRVRLEADATHRERVGNGVDDEELIGDDEADEDWTNDDRM